LNAAGCAGWDIDVVIAGTVVGDVLEGRREMGDELGVEGACDGGAVVGAVDDLDVGVGWGGELF